MWVGIKVNSIQIIFFSNFGCQRSRAGRWDEGRLHAAARGLPLRVGEHGQVPPRARRQGRRSGKLECLSKINGLSNWNMFVHSHGGSFTCKNW